jgi:hypothetical protein
MSRGIEVEVDVPMHQPCAVTPWELEAERRREVVKADVRASRQRAHRGLEVAVLPPSPVSFSAVDPSDRRADTARCAHPVGQALVPGK